MPLKYPVRRKIIFSVEKCCSYFHPCFSEHWSPHASTLPHCWGDHMTPIAVNLLPFYEEKDEMMAAYFSALSKSSLSNRIDGTEHGQTIFFIKTLSRGWSPAPLDHPGWIPEPSQAGSWCSVCACEHWRRMSSYAGVSLGAVQMAVLPLASNQVAVNSPGGRKHVLLTVSPKKKPLLEKNCAEDEAAVCLWS